MQLSPLKRNKRMYQKIIEQIQLLIKAGKIQPGDRLPSERILAEKLAVSRTSVKEAISVLESNGIVEVKQGVGVFLIQDRNQVILDKITTIVLDKRTDVVDLLELREAIECKAAYYAARRCTIEDEEHLRNLLSKLKLAQENGLGAKEDFEFHMAIIKASRNSLMLRIMNLVSTQLLQTVTFNREDTMSLSGDNNIVYEEHEQILKAIIENNPEKARNAMNNHLKATEARHYL